jgi:protein O-GlcNAc transferase
MELHRNAPCPCGSGLKYKRCCGRLEQGSLTGESQERSPRELLREGLKLFEIGDLHRAAVFFQNILQSEPDHSDALQYLGMVHFQLGNVTEAEKLVRRAVEADPKNDLALSNLALVLIERGELDEAYSCCTRALSVNGSNLHALNQAGLLMEKRNQLDLAEEYLNKAISLDSDYANANYNLASVLLKVGRFREAFRYIHKTITLDPELSANRLLDLNYPDDIDRETLFNLHRLWGEKTERKCLSKTFHHAKRESSPERKIRIGYLSPDYREHSVGFYIQHVIASHDQSKFEVYCYANSEKSDSVSRYIERHAHRFRRVKDMDWHALARLIHADGVDILVDLAGHTGGTCVEAMAYRPAPVQMTYLGYPNTTGLTTVDYRISDPFVDVEDGTKYTERLLVLPQCFLCFDQFIDRPIQVEPAFKRNGLVTFGSFNNLYKLSPPTVRLWSQLLQTFENSRLLIKAKGADDPTIQRNIRSGFEEQGLEPDRLRFIGSLPSREEHLDYYNNIDIALDPFPYNGTTTTCESLWMGVPVITLVGKMHCQRVSFSILKNIGCEETIAQNEQEYLEIAMALAADTKRLESLRARIPGLIRNSILCQPERFTRQLESAYRSVWDEYLEREELIGSGLL